MEKDFEDYFGGIQTDMIAICLEYAKGQADKIYIHVSSEGNVISCDFFYCIQGHIVRKHRLNDVISDKERQYDTSAARQTAVMDVLFEDAELLRELHDAYKKEMPAEIRMTYDVANNSVKAEYKYGLVYSPDPHKTADDVVAEWFAEQTDLQKWET